MKKLTIAITVIIACVCTLGAGTAYAQFGIRGGIGTDLSGGIAYGVGANYLIAANTNFLELGLSFFGGQFKETTDEGIHTYEEKTDVVVIGMMANYLAGYQPRGSKAFFVAGIGLGSISMDWEESSNTDTSLGTPIAGGGSMQSESGSGGGIIFNLGGGYSFSSPLDLRFEVPIFVTFAAPDRASSVIPTFILTAGYRFN